MPIAGYKPTVTTTPPSEPVETKPFETTLVDNNEQPIESLLPFVSGSRWSVDWWHQNLDADDTLTGFDPNTPDTLQQYIWIEDLILHVDTPITTETDPNGLTVTQTGSAVYLNDVPPYVGDIFIAPILDNRIAVYKVTESKRKSYSKRTVYEISYTSIAFVADKNDPLLKSLGDRTIRKYVYEESNYVDGGSPLVSEEDYKRKVSLKERFHHLANYYLEQMIEEETKLLLLPGQEHRVFDHMVQSFVTKIIPSDDIPAARRMNRNTPNVAYLNTKTIWDVLVERNDYGIQTISRVAEPISTNITGERTVTRSLWYLGVEYVILPSDKPLVHDGDTTLTENYTIVRPPLDNYSTPTAIPNPPLIPDVFSIDTYVFSQGWYRRENSGLSAIETLVNQYLNNEPLDTDKLIELTEYILNVDPVNQYYMIPVILLLIRSHYGGIRSEY